MHHADLRGEAVGEEGLMVMACDLLFACCWP
jgi:hypothetical protein